MMDAEEPNQPPIVSRSAFLENDGTPVVSCKGMDHAYEELFHCNKESLVLKPKKAIEYVRFIEFLKDNGFSYAGTVFYGYMSERWVHMEHRCLVSLITFIGVRHEILNTKMKAMFHLDKYMDAAETDTTFGGYTISANTACFQQNHDGEDAFGLILRDKFPLNYSNSRYFKDYKAGIYELIDRTTVPKSLSGHFNISLKKEDQEFNAKLIAFYASLDEEAEDDLNKKKFLMIRQDNYGLSTTDAAYKFMPVKDDRFDLYYGKQFPYEKITKFVTEDDTDNLMLLHGDPGTGKSNFLKHLCDRAKKDVIYIPPNMVSVLSAPTFVDFMLKNKNSILLIEDAEEILSKDRNSATNNLLGMTDGFLKDAMNMKIICTFNKSIGDVDDALLRKGRLYLEYGFKKLSSEETNALGDFLELNIPASTDRMTLAEIFNFHHQNTDQGINHRRKIGFN